MSKEILASTLFEPGSMIKITDDIKDKTLPPNSLGFISHIQGIDNSYQNVAKIHTIIIRIGKGGKNRIKQHAYLSVPIFKINHEKFNKTLMPDSNRKSSYQKNHIFVNVERIMPPKTNVLDMTPMEFLGYSVAMSCNLKQMSDQCQHRKWTTKKNNPINAMRRAADRFEEDPEHYIAKCESIDFRTDFINEIRPRMIALIKIKLRDDLIKAHAELNAIKFILFVNSGEFLSGDKKADIDKYKFTDNSILERTVKHYQTVKENIESLLQ